MKYHTLLIASCLVSFDAGLLAQEPKSAAKEAALRDAPASSTQFVTVADNVKLEVVDWGGTGRPLVLLAGLGATAHAFDKFAPKLTPAYHVYGVTRRGFGASTIAASGYAADDLGDDVLAVVDFLKLEKPVLVGHSLAGEELSSVATRHPEKIAGLVYLEAGYGYAYYDAARGDLMIDSLEVQKKLEQLQPGSGLRDPRVLIDDLLQALPQLEKDLRTMQGTLPTVVAPASTQMPPPPAVPAPIRAIMAGQRKYTAIPVPALAFYAVPHDLKAAFRNNPEAQAKAEADDAVTTEAQAKAFETGVPSARVVRIAHASHVIYRSNEEEVLREMRAFIERLP